MPAQVDLPPPPVDIDEGGGDAGWVELTRARGDIDARLLAGRLEETGIETIVLRDNSGAAWLYGARDPYASVAILVRKIQLEDARIVLAEIALESPAELRPPNRRVPKTRIVWWATALALGAVIALSVLLQMLARSSACQLPVFCTNATVQGGTSSE